jgi:hypothetical protein
MEVISSSVAVAAAVAGPELAMSLIPYQWMGHFDMLHDTRRNAAYAAATTHLGQRVALSRPRNLDEEDSEGLLFCDIGTGSGLLASLIGKNVPHSKVIAIETVPKLAKIARETVLRNGLMEQVFVYNMHSSTIDGRFMASHFGRRANGTSKSLFAVSNVNLPWYVSCSLRTIGHWVSRGRVDIKHDTCKQEHCSEGIQRIEKRFPKDSYPSSWPGVPASGRW